MKIVQSSFYVEVLENGEIKLVPHDDKKNYRFPIKADAVSFLTQLRSTNPDTMFRLVCNKNEFTIGDWNRLKESTTSK